MLYMSAGSAFLGLALFLLITAPDIASSFTAASTFPKYTRHEKGRASLLASTAGDDQHDGSENMKSVSPQQDSRRGLLISFAASAAVVGITTFVSSSPANARFVLDDDTGDFVEVQDEDWQTAWKQRLDKASGMSKDEIFQAARGAGNVKSSDEDESPASKKRRAMSSCRDANLRAKANAGSEKECTARVFSGEVDFMLNAL